MLAEKINGYAEAKAELEQHMTLVKAKSTEVMELDNQIKETKARLTAIQGQIEAAPLQMAKSEMSSEEFVKLRYECDAIQAMLKGLEELRSAQKLAYTSLSEKQNALQQSFSKMLDDYAQKMLENLIDGAIESARDGLKIFISSIVAGEKSYTKPDALYYQIGSRLYQAVYSGKIGVHDFHNAQNSVQTVKQSFITEQV